MKRKGMLEILADIVQASGLQSDTEQDLLNFISELDTDEENTINSYRDCILKFINEIDNEEYIKRIYRMTQYLWLKGECNGNDC